MCFEECYKIGTFSFKNEELILRGIYSTSGQGNLNIGWRHQDIIFKFRSEDPGTNENF